MSDQSTLPERSLGDAIHSVAKAAIGSIPVVGSAGSELFAYVVTAPYERRREEWMREVGDAIAELRDVRGVDIEALRANPEFADTVLAATQAALRTGDAEKRRRLHHAVVNAALPQAPDAAAREQFIRLVDELTSWHVRLLDVFAAPQDWLARNGRTFEPPFSGSLSELVESAWPELRGRRDFYDRIWSDLHGRSLVTTSGLHTMMTGHGLLASRVSEYGQQFLAYVREPIVGDAS